MLPEIKVLGQLKKTIKLKKRSSFKDTIEEHLRVGSQKASLTNSVVLVEGLTLIEVSIQAVLFVTLVESSSRAVIVKEEDYLKKVKETIFLKTLFWLIKVLPLHSETEELKVTKLTIFFQGLL